MGIENDSVMANTRHGCPEPEQLAAYLDGRLNEEARLDIEQHAFECDECRSVLAEAAVSSHRGAGDMSRSSERSGGRRLFVAAAILATAAALIIGVRLVIRPSGSAGNADSSQSQWLTFVAAVAQEPTRPLEGRLQGFAYAPPPTVTRGGSRAEPSPNIRITAAGVETEAAATDTPVARTRLGVAQMAVGDVDSAVKTLETVAGVAEDADAYNDLAVAYLTRGVQTGRASDLALALTAAQHARAIQPDSQPAWFNETLILEALNRHAEARHAMDGYLKLDANSPWAKELRERLRSQ